MAINMHFMISQETYDQAIETLDDIKNDKRLEKLNAIVFLSLKQRGRGEKFTPLSEGKFKYLVNYALDKNINIGFDSCSAYKFLKSVEDHQRFEHFKMCSEPCESSAFSIYCNTEGHFFPCSFAEGIREWKEGLDIGNCKDFLKDIWNHKKTNEFRKKLLSTKHFNNLGCRTCPMFKV